MFGEREQLLLSDYFKMLFVILFIQFLFFAAFAVEKKKQEERKAKKRKTGFMRRIAYSPMCAYLLFFSINYLNGES